MVDISSAKKWSEKGTKLHKLGRKLDGEESFTKYEEAIKCFDKALGIEPSAKIWNKKGNSFWNLALWKKRKWEEVLECYDKALEIEPDMIDALISKGDVLGLKLKKYKQPLYYCKLF